MHLILFYVCSLVIRLKWFILSDYYGRLAVQAQYLYKQSDLFRMRWQEISLDYAEESFNGEIAVHFFNKAQKEPFIIRWQHFKNSVIGRPVQPYVISDN